MQFVIDHQNILICLGCARIPPSLCSHFQNMKRAFEPVVEPVAPPTTLLEALLAAPQLRQIPAAVFKYLVVPYARSPVEAAFQAWTEKFKLESRGDWVHLLLLAVYGVPRGVFLGNYGPLAGWLCGVRGEWEKPYAWLNPEYQRLRE